jgi:RiboL-PSP-HEPN
MTRVRPRHSLEARSQVKRLKAELDDLYIRSDPRQIADPEIGGDLARYLCVRVSGYLEQATAVILRSHCTKQSWGNVQQFAVSWLDRTPNLNSDALVKMVRRFNNQIAEELEGFLAVEERGSGLNSLIGLRNDIAHGRQQGMSREQAWEYFTLAESVIDWLLEKFDPLPVAVQSA